MLKSSPFAFLPVLLIMSCASLSRVTDRNAYNPVPDKLGIYKIHTANDGTVASGQIMVDNLSIHDLGGVVKCNWFNAMDSFVFSETQNFDLKSGEQKLLGFSVPVPLHHAKMRLKCNFIYVICHDCGEKVMLDVQK